MHPELEAFLEKAFASVQPTSPGIGRVVVEPDYNAEPDAKDAHRLAGELVQQLRQVSLDKNAIASHQGQTVETSGLLRKYIRRITLHADTVEGDWVEVAPPGNWI